MPGMPGIWVCQMPWVWDARWWNARNNAIWAWAMPGMPGMEECHGYGRPGMPGMPGGMPGMIWAWAMP